MTGLPPAEEATHYSLLNGRRPRASSTSSGCDTSGHFGDVALCVRIPRSGRFEALSSPSGRLKRTLRGRSVMRPTVGRLALRPQSVRARRAGRRTLSQAKPGQIRPRPRSVRPGPAAGHPPPNTGRPPPGDAGGGLGKGGRRPGAAAAPREGARPGRPSPEGDGTRTGRAPAPRDGRGAGRPAPRAARASRRPSWSPAARPAAPEGAARSRRPARRCRSRR